MNLPSDRPFGLAGPVHADRDVRQSCGGAQPRSRRFDRDPCHVHLRREPSRGWRDLTGRPRDADRSGDRGAAARPGTATAGTVGDDCRQRRLANDGRGRAGACGAPAIRRGHAARPVHAIACAVHRRPDAARAPGRRAYSERSAPVSRAHRWAIRRSATASTAAASTLLLARHGRAQLVLHAREPGVHELRCRELQRWRASRSGACRRAKARIVRARRVIRAVRPAAGRA